MNIHSEVYKQNISSNIDYIFRHSILQGRLWEEEVVRKIVALLEDNVDVLDVGAHIGLVTLGIHLLNQKKNVRFHCFECNVDSFIKLKSNTESHPTIDIYNFGLGSQFLLGNMSTSAYNNGMAFIKNEQTEDYSKEITYDCFRTCEQNNKIEKNTFFTVIRLDDIRYLFKRRVSIIKVDIEGYEDNFLLGAKEFLQEHKPYLFIEIFDECKGKIFKILETYRYTLIEHIQKPDERSIDYLFGPSK